MPTKVVSFRCNVCDTVHSGIDAEKKANECEALGKPKFKHRTGGLLHLPRENHVRNSGAIVEVRKIGLRYSLHEPFYRVVWADDNQPFNGPEKNGWVSESELDRVCQKYVKAHC